MLLSQLQRRVCNLGAYQAPFDPDKNLCLSGKV